MFRNWESAVKHARDDLRKTPIPDTQEFYDPDPGSKRPPVYNMLHHLDEVVRIAFFDKVLEGAKWPNESGVSISVAVSYQGSNNRRHVVETKWDKDTTATDAQRNVKGLTITMKCPLGGWLGWATLELDPYAGQIKELRATWTVPDDSAFRRKNAPDQLLFIFCGAESVPSADGRTPGILQPVLQWTPAHDSISAGWRIRSWYVPATYDPSIEDFPDPKCVKLPNVPFDPKLCPNVKVPPADKAQPYWTEAVSVQIGDTLTSVITFDKDHYECHFDYTPKGASAGTKPTPMVSLAIPADLPPLTYASAVIEGYVKGAKKAQNGVVDRAYLPAVVMTGVSLDPLKPPLEWDVGESGVQNGDGIVYGTNRIRSYVVTADEDTLTFTPKEPGEHH
jgi:hypothetical protein